MNGATTAQALAHRSFVGPALIAAMLALAAAAAIRYGVIQPPQLGWTCQAAGHPWWCTPREALILTLQAGALGWCGVAAGLVSLLGGGRAICALAVVCGAASLLLYGAGAGALGLLLGLLRALRLRAGRHGTR